MGGIVQQLNIFVLQTGDFHVLIVVFSSEQSNSFVNDEVQFYISDFKWIEMRTTNIIYNYTIHVPYINSLKSPSPLEEAWGLQCTLCLQQTPLNYNSYSKRMVSHILSCNVTWTTLDFFDHHHWFFSSNPNGSFNTIISKRVISSIRCVCSRR